MTDISRPRFHRSAYWGTWSLVLTNRWRALSAGGRPGLGSTVEINLTPVNGWAACSDADLARVASLNLRVHCTMPGANDLFERDLPSSDRVMLDSVMGDKLAAWLLDPATEILGLVNWAKHAKLSNDGAPLRDSAWGHLAHLIPQGEPQFRQARPPEALAA